LKISAFSIINVSAKKMEIAKTIKIVTFGTENENNFWLVFGSVVTETCLSH